MAVPNAAGMVGLCLMLAWSLGCIFGVWRIMADQRRIFVSDDPLYHLCWSGVREILRQISQ